MKKFLSLIALILSLCFLLSGCSPQLFYQLLQQLQGGSSFSQMVYTRPDTDALESAMEAACRAADSGSTDDTLDAIFTYYDVYDSFSTNCQLAYIRYCQNTADLYWQQENSYCLEVEHLPDTSLDALYEHLSNSAIRQDLEEKYFGEGFFDYYFIEGNTAPPEAFLELLEEESALLDQYYTLSTEAEGLEYYSEDYFSAYFTPMTELLVEMIRLRQEIAQAAGYDDYAQFAFDYYYSRSYTPEQVKNYLLTVGSAMAPLYQQLGQIGYPELDYCSSQETYNYLKEATTNMGDSLAEAFDFLERNGLYDIEYSETKAPTTFEVYLWSYDAPFVFVDPYLDQADKLSFAHEFGHFANDYICGGSYANIDVAEVHSQGLEYLSLCYTENSEDLAYYKLAESLCVYVEQAAYALFELEAYSLTGDQLTAENVAKLYEDIGQAFHFDSFQWDPRDLICITHFYSDPMYVLSYVSSNDLAMQLYELELDAPGDGLDLYKQFIEQGEENLEAFVETYGFTDPMTAERVAEAAAFFTSHLLQEKGPGTQPGPFL